MSIVTSDFFLSFSLRKSRLKNSAGIPFYNDVWIALLAADLFINFPYLISKDLHSEGIALCLHNQVFCYTHDIMRFLSHLSEQRDLLVKIAPALPEHGRRRVAMHHTGFNVHVHFSAGPITRVGGFDRTHSRQFCRHCNRYAPYPQKQ